MPSAGEIHFETGGDESYPPLLFLHGFLGSHTDWESITLGLWDRFRTITVDLPGHAASRFEDSDDYTIRFAADRIMSLLDQLKIARVGLVGYSMGGRLAWYLLVHHADRFGQAVIESASPGIETEHDQQARANHDSILADNLRRTELEDWLSRWYDQPIFETLTKRPELLKQTMASKLSHDKVHLARALEGMSVGHMENLWPRLKELGHEILFIAGANDKKYAEIGKRTARLCPNARTVIIEETGHNVHLEQPERYLNELRKFLRQES